MANLHNMYQGVIAALQEYRPTIEFPAPPALVEYYIYVFAAESVFERKEKQRATDIIIEGWMIHQFDCLNVSTLSAPACVGSCYNTEYYVDLEAEAVIPKNLPNEAGIHKLWIEQSMTPITLIPYSKLGMIKGLRVDEPSMEKPSATYYDNKLWLFGGNRKFSKTNIRIHIVPGITPPVTQAGECLNKTASVPIPTDMEAEVIQKTAAWLHSTLTSGNLDLITDGRYEQAATSR